MISKWKNAPCFQPRTGGSGHRFHNEKNGAAQAESNQRPPACNSTALVPRAIYDTGWGRRVNNTTLFFSVVPLRPDTPGPGLCRSLFSRPVCPYAIVTFDPVTRDVTILAGAVSCRRRPASALTGGGGRPRWGGAARTHLMVGCTFSVCHFKEWTEWDAPINWSATQTGAT